MCGIAGILFPEGSADNTEQRARAMQRALLHRGPDGQGLHLANEAALVHTRLALLDLDHGQQPMHDASGRYTLVFNGEIVNHLELRRELEHYEFRTDSDSETLLAAWITWGQGCLTRLDGMFAFVIWDQKKREAHMARDALGVKPLVYGRRGDEVVFASEAKAILAAGWGREINEQALVEYIIAPSLSGVRQSMFKGLEHLPAGHLVTISRGQRSSPQAWFRHSSPSSARFSDDELALRLRSALTTSVQRSLRADVPVGVFLSGGLDSTILTYLAARQSDLAPPMAFTLRFEDHEEIDYAGSSIVISDDAPFVDQVSEDLGLTLVHARLSQAQMIADLPRLTASNDRIPAWEQEFGQDALARAASGRRKAVLVGDAADETHFGYFFLLDQEVSASPLAMMKRFGASERLACLSPRLQRHYDPLHTLDAAYRAIAAEAGASFEGPVAERRRALTVIIQQLWLGRLLHNGDVHTMAHGIEARVPFSGIELLKVIADIALDQGFAGGVEKALLRRAARAWIPTAICERRKSALPRDPRMGPLYQRELRRLLAMEADFAHQILNVEVLRDLCGRPVTSEQSRALLFTMVALLHWKRQHIG